MQRGRDLRNIKSCFVRFFAVVGAIPVVLALVQSDVLTVEQAVGVIVAIVITVAVVSSVMCFILPLFSIAFFITYNAASRLQGAAQVV